MASGSTQSAFGARSTALEVVRHLSLSGKQAIVTGGARGQGAAQAQVLAKNGAAVVITDLRVDGGNVVAAAIGGDARFIMRGEQKIEIAVVKPGNTRRAGRPDNPIGNPLFEALRAKRRALAENVGVPPYVIFHDATLREMALTRPADIRALARISGVGTRKLEAYGAEFLSVIAQF
jgi:superfamily II DNA helicase RecQ